MTLKEAQQQIKVFNDTISEARLKIRAIEDAYIRDNCEFQIGERVTVDPTRKSWTAQITRINVDIPAEGYGRPWFKYHGRRVLANGELSDNTRELWQTFVKP